MSTIKQIEDLCGTNKLVDESKLKCYVQELIKINGDLNSKPTTKELDTTMRKLRYKYKLMPSKSQIRYIYEKYFNDIHINHMLARYMIKKACRSRSGVLVSTIVLKPDVFSCPKKCSYCPTETDLYGNPTQPKSYLSTEPAMLRALQHNFDIRLQIYDRINTYINTGNIQLNAGSCKMEIILSGGTWESYSYDYRNKVMNEIYWAANTYGEYNPRAILSLEEEIKINETAKFLIIGLTIETRPDFITKKTIKDYRMWGVTRVQIGVQHYSDIILDIINRECYRRHTISAIKMLKQVGFKVVCHLMPDLPGSTPELDIWMFKCAINDPDLQFDDVKIYPCAVCKSADPNLIVKSDIADWYEKGTYIPYAEQNLNNLIRVLKYYKTNIQPWIRIQRLVRDIPKQSIRAGYEGISNLRQIIQNQMKEEGTRCRCIRCMEIGDEDKLMESPNLVVRSYIASGDKEYYISIESNQKSIFMLCHYYYYKVINFCSLLFTAKKIWWNGHINTYNGLIGFCRLRIDSKPGGDYIKELKDCALIREVHVYGHCLSVGSTGLSSQHRGFGQLLVKTAEHIAIQNGFSKIAVIAGVGTREYYKNKCGYELIGTYMIKNIEKELIKFQKNNSNKLFFWSFIIMLLSVIYYITHHLF